MAEKIRITLIDNSEREVLQGTTTTQIAASISTSIAKKALAGRFNGQMIDLSQPLFEDGRLEIITAENEAEALELVRHDYAHILAEAVQKLFPGTQITFGPVTDDGFYYDFAPKDRPFTEEDLPLIEAEMRKIIAQNNALVREVWERDKLISLWESQGEKFKAGRAGANYLSRRRVVRYVSGASSAFYRKT